ncbi:hypothetical protein Tco_0292211 [Tanacetum coccineum]
MLVQNQAREGEAPQTDVSQAAVSQIIFHGAHIEQIPPSLTTYQRKRKTHKYRRTKKDTELPQTSVPQTLGVDEAVHKEGVIVAEGTDIGGSPRRQETIGGTPAQTRSERVLEQPIELPLLEGHTSGSREGSMEYIFELTDNVPPTPHDSPLTGGHTPGSDEGRLKLEDLMDICTNLSNRVLALEEAKTAQDRVITRLKLRVRRLEKKRKAITPQPIKRRLFKGRVESSTDKSLDEEDASKQGRNTDKTKLMFKDSDFDVLDDAMENVEETVNAATTEVNTVSAPVTTVDFNKMKEHKAKEKGVIIIDVEDSRAVRPARSITTLQPLPTIDPKDKGKGVLVEEESDPLVKIKRSDQGNLQVLSDAELAQLLHQQELAEVERRQRERVAQEEASMAAIYEEYDTIQASIDADALFAAKLQQEERERFTIEERAKFLVETIAAQRKFRAAQRTVEIRSKPPTKSQLKNLMLTYLKNICDYKNSQLKGKTYEEIHELYERQQKRIQDFIPMDSEKEVIKDSGKKDNSSSKPSEGTRRKTLARKRSGEKQSKESVKRQKLEDTAEEQESIEITEEA